MVNNLIHGLDDNPFAWLWVIENLVLIIWLYNAKTEREKRGENATKTR